MITLILNIGHKLGGTLMNTKEHVNYLLVYYHYNFEISGGEMVVKKYEGRESLLQHLRETFSPKELEAMMKRKELIIVYGANLIQPKIVEKEVIKEITF
jgi:ubiquinone/menaquinone biosynthesis C-methylase UbiE